MKDLSRAEFVALVAALSTINSAAIDVMLPALPNLGDAFGVANPNDRSLVLTAFLVGLGLPQLFFGPVSDRLGRRGPLLAGITIFSLAAFAALVAPSFTALLALRFIQGMGSAVVSVSIQAAVRDRFSGRAMAEVMSLATTIFMVVPIVAPGVGQLILLGGHWPLNFVFMGVFGLVAAVWSWLRLPETLAGDRRRPFTLRSVGEAFRIVLTNRVALFYGLAGMFMFGGVLGWVNSAQQIFVGVYGLGALFPLAFAAMPVAFAVASLSNWRLVGLIGRRRLAHSSMFAFIAVTGLWLACALAGFQPLWLFLAMTMLTALTQGLAWGNIGSLMMEPLGAVAGTASALFGALSTVGAAFLGLAVAQAFDSTPLPVIASFFLLGLAIVMCFLLAERGRLFGAEGTGEAQVEASATRPARR